MSHRLTNIDKSLNRIIYIYCVIFAAICMIFAFSSCSNMRSVKSKGSQGISKTSKSKNYDKVDTVSSNITEFEEKILNNKNKNVEITNEDAEEDTRAISSQSAIDITSKRLPTLREQMQNLAQDQETIKTQVNTLQTDVNDIKNSIDDIRDAITVLKYSPDKTPAKGPEPVEVTNEDDFEQTQEQLTEDDYSIVQSDEKAAVKKAAPEPKKVANNNAPKKTVKPQPAKKQNKTTAHNTPVKTQKPAENKQIAVKKAEPNNFKAASKVETKPQAVQTPPIAPANNAAPKDLNNNVRSALDYFGKKDYHKAINELNTILTKSKDNQTVSNCNYWLGESYFRLSNYSEAIKFFNKTANDGSSPKNAEARIMIGESLIRMGKVEDAKNAFESFLANHPKSQYAPRAKKMLQQL